MDDSDFEAGISASEREAVRSSLAELGAEPLPYDIAARLDARLAAELDSSPLAERRARRRRVRLGASLSAAAAVAALAVFALTWGGGGGHAPEGGSATALQSTVAAAQADAAAKSTAGAAMARPAAARACRPASRTGGDRRRAVCPGARGGHARAV